MLTWHGGKSDVSNVNVGTCCSVQLGTACLEPEWPGLLYETTRPMAEWPPTGSQSPACEDFSF